MGRRMVSALTLPKCHKLSSSTRCLMATWALTSKCCILQPPQAPVCKPKWGQPGRTRSAELRWMAVSSACSQLFFLRLVWALTSSPGKAPSIKTTLPSGRWATPCASMSMDSMRSQPSGRSVGKGLSAQGAGNAAGAGGGEWGMFCSDMVRGLSQNVFTISARRGAGCGSGWAARRKPQT